VATSRQRRQQRQEARLLLQRNSQINREYARQQKQASANQQRTNKKKPGPLLDGLTTDGPVDKGPQATQARDSKSVGKVLGLNMYLAKSRKPKKTK
jgi:hypothetical protein